MFISKGISATRLLATLFSYNRAPKQCYLLTGDVGAGKSAFSREFVRSSQGDIDMDVPSPTFLLKLEYRPVEGPVISHIDLYRVPNAEARARLDLYSDFDKKLCLIEWANYLSEQELDKLKQNSSSFQIYVQIITEFSAPTLGMDKLQAVEVLGGRSFVVTAYGDTCCSRLQEIKNFVLKNKVLFQEDGLSVFNPHIKVKALY